MKNQIRKFEQQSGIEIYGLGKDRAKWEDSLEKFAELIIREHLIVWEMMDNGNKVAGYVEMEDYPKAIIKHFRDKNETTN